MSEINFIYTSLKLFEFIIFLIYGYRLSKSKSNYWKLAIIPILTFSIIEGLRFGREIDYNEYYFRYIHIGKDFNSENYELIFKSICYVCYNIGIPYYLFIFFQCMFLITCTFLFIKRYRAAIKYILPLILFELYDNNMFIRWYLAFSFFLLFIHYFLDKKYIKSFTFLIITCLTHIGFIFFIPFILLYKYLSYRCITPKISIPIFFISLFFSNLTYINILSDISNILLKFGIGSIDSRIDLYLNSTDDILSGDFGYVGILDLTLSNSIRLALSYLPAMIWGGHIMKKQPGGTYLFNLFIIGAIISPLFLKVEILDRISSVLVFFSTICCGYTFQKFIHLKGKRIPYITMFCVLSYISALWPNISIAFKENLKDNQMLFIWDANGRNYLNTIRKEPY